MTSISDLVSSQHQVLKELKNLIGQEKAALHDQKADALLALASNKAKLLDALRSTDDCLSSHPEKHLLETDPSLSQQVDDAKTLLQECQQLNAENAALIELSIASLNRFSQALQASRNSSSMTYDDKGKTSTISSLGNDLKA